jgi:hypothetical protein
MRTSQASGSPKDQGRDGCQTSARKYCRYSPALTLFARRHCPLASRYSSSGKSGSRNMNSDFRKSSYSSSSGGNCVEAGTDGAVLVRDSQQQGNGPVLRVDPADWLRLLASIVKLVSREHRPVSRPREAGFVMAGRLHGHHARSASLGELLVEETRGLGLATAFCRALSHCPGFDPRVFRCRPCW